MLHLVLEARLPLFWITLVAARTGRAFQSVSVASESRKHRIAASQEGHFPGSEPPCEEGARGSKTDSANACLMVPPLYLTGRVTANLDVAQLTTTAPSSRVRIQESHGRQSQGPGDRPANPDLICFPDRVAGSDAAVEGHVAVVSNTPLPPPRRGPDQRRDPRGRRNLPQPQCQRHLRSPRHSIRSTMEARSPRPPRTAHFLILRLRHARIHHIVNHHLGSRNRP